MTNQHDEQEDEIRESWRRLRESQSKRAKKRVRDIRNVKTILLFVFVIIIFILFYVLIKGFMQKSVPTNNDVIRIEIRDFLDGKKEK